MIDFYKRVEEIRVNKGLKKGEFAEMIGSRSSTYATLLKGKTANGELAITLNKLFNVNLNWLLTGVGDMYNKPFGYECSYFTYLENTMKRIFTDNLKLSNRRVLVISAYSKRGIEIRSDFLEHLFNTTDTKYQIIDATDKTKPQILKEIKQNSHNSDLKEAFYYTEIVFIIKNISQSKIAKKEQGFFMRSLLKVNDDAHFNSVIPSSELIFIDYACFIQENIEIISTYSNIV